jgi:hypothetical protein
MRLRINGQAIRRVIIDPHYKKKHPDMTDELILKLVKKLDGRRFDPDKESGPYQYFRAEPVIDGDKFFRVIFLLVQSEDFLGVINAFRVKARKG